ncbi:MAG: hypothetical protein PHS09_06615 [Candidatus Omnitrophica bacterium]|nr:hypothetical protein [Candidatus Omnitrophota bacterium]
MIKQPFIALIFLFVFCLSAGYCAGGQRIELDDGSVLNAEVKSLENGIYTLDTGSMGEIRLDASRVKKIESGSPGPNSFASKVHKYQQKMTQDPAALKLMNKLAKDQRFQQIAQDPQILEAIKSGDMQALTSNPKFISLMNDPEIRAIGEEFKP